MRRMVVTSLRPLNGVHPSEAASGLEAIEQLALRSINLIVLDLNMPDMHGMEVIDFVRRHRAYKSIPIVVLTTKGEEASRAKAIEAGANQYVTKPFDPGNLARIVASLLDN
jgi:two-component system, chemotaxis family, chemotaxis protein CheY